MKTQKDMYYDAVKRSAEQNEVFLTMINDPEHPLTNKELQVLIKKRPSVWGKFSSYVGKLTD